ncbi:MAG: hypothetical protein PVI15_10910, partial [Chromatiales bacterium]
MKQSILKSIVVLVTGALAGCATIVSGPSQTLPVSSDPGGAEIIIYDEHGVEVFKGETPTKVVLNKSDGGYFDSKAYVVEISKPGYATQSIPVQAEANGWYIAGNLIFGGLIGWLIVDPVTGSMYTLDPEDIETPFSEQVAHNNKAT